MAQRITFDFILDANGIIHGSLVDLKDAQISQFHVDAEGSPFVVTTPSSDPKNEYHFPYDNVDNDHSLRRETSSLLNFTLLSNGDHYDSAMNNLSPCHRSSQLQHYQDCRS